MTSQGILYFLGFAYVADDQTYINASMMFGSYCWLIYCLAEHSIKLLDPLIRLKLSDTKFCCHQCLLN
jgi:hypothetical protein